MSDLSVALPSGTGSPPHVSEYWQRDLGRCHYDHLVRGMNARAGPSLRDEVAPHWQEVDHLPTGLVSVVGVRLQQPHRVTDVGAHTSTMTQR